MPTTPTRLSSRRHGLVTLCRALARGPRDGQVLLDGAHLVDEAIAANATIEAVLGTADGLKADGPLAGALRSSRFPIYEVTNAVLEAASPARSPSGVVGIARWTATDVAHLFSPPPALVVGLVDVQDPGNVGAVVRAADALGATGVATVGRSADPGGWKALRGSMGSVFRLPIARADLQALLAEAARLQVPVLAAVPRGGRPPSDADLTRPAVLLLGHEGMGLPDGIVRQAEMRISLPMKSGVESINVSVAAALLIDEARRQRSRTTKARADLPGQSA